MKRFQFAIALMMALVSTVTFGREPVPIVNHENVPVVTGSGKPATSEQVMDAILAAGAAQQWTMRVEQPGLIYGTQSWNNNKHTIAADIAYSGDKVSIKYKSSINMKYGTKEGVEVIHPFYNRNVQELLNEIRKALIKL